MRVVPVPAELDHRSIDALFEAATEGPGAVREGSERVLLDSHRLRWIDPMGMIGLLAAGAFLRDRIGARPALTLPESSEVVGYLGRMGFFEAADELFQVDRPRPRGAASSDVLLEITPIVENHDVHGVVERVQERAGVILSKTLGYPASSVIPFSVMLSEVCQNILEHAGAPGWVAAQSYNWSRRLGRHVLVLAVGDMGRGFRESLGSEHAGRYGDRWSDATALEAAFIHGLTRFPDQGRGQGIQQMRRQVRRWDGMISVRSGDTRIADVPDWLDFPPMERNLPRFPGAQVTLVLPEMLEEDR